ncbi:hypothetical protein LPN04_10800 [Rugamonas sp. A1-17]|nr:hypothetical protein [Rugamonas sp. A1-17]
MNWSVRKSAWSLVGLAGLFSVWVWLGEARQAPAAADTATPAPARRPSASPARAAARDAAQREPLAEAAADPFKVVSFLPPPKPVEAVAVAAPPPPPPVAPPFPYRYLGRMLSVDGKLLTYLARGDAIVPVQPQQVLDHDYRIDTLNDTELVITYLPLDERVRIPLRSAEN